MGDKPDLFLRQRYSIQYDGGGIDLNKTIIGREETGAWHIAYYYPDTSSPLKEEPKNQAVSKCGDRILPGAELKWLGEVPRKDICRKCAEAVQWSPETISLSDSFSGLGIEAHPIGPRHVAFTIEEAEVLLRDYRNRRK